MSIVWEVALGLCIYIAMRVGHRKMHTYICVTPPPQKQMLWLVTPKPDRLLILKLLCGNDYCHHRMGTISYSKSRGTMILTP